MLGGRQVLGPGGIPAMAESPRAACFFPTTDVGFVNAGAPSIIGGSWPEE